jgi:putative nicotinate phosphoribosyltransferase
MDTALLTDKYELTMLSSLVSDGLADTPATFELFARRLPAGRRFAMIAGLGRFLDALDEFTWTEAQLGWLRDTGAITDRAADWLADFRFAGDVFAYPEGEVHWPGSPVVRVSGRLGECLLLETLALSIYNHDTAVASAAARMVLAADGRPIIEMGSRRVHEWAAVAAARSAWIAGFAGTSNLAAGRRYGIPTLGTAAHAFTLAHASEADAFASQVRAHGPGTTLLVDTYDIEQGIRTAVEVAGTELGAIRIDSGDLALESHKARTLLDDLGATLTRIITTSDLDEYVMAALADAPIDGYGAGTRVVTGSGHPTAGFVYKLVDVDGRPVAKKSADKGSVGGVKTPYRLADGAEHYSLDGSVPEGARAMQEQVVTAGVIVPRPTLDQSRDTAAATLRGLDPSDRLISDGTPRLTLSEGDRS